MKHISLGRYTKHLPYFALAISVWLFSLEQVLLHKSILGISNPFAEFKTFFPLLCLVYDMHKL
jgi:hypothetical protein